MNLTQALVTALLLITFSRGLTFETQEVPQSIAYKAKNFLKPQMKVRRLCLPCGDTAFTEFTIQTLEVLKSDSLYNLHVIRINDKARSIAQLFILKDSVWRNLAVLSGLNWPGTPDPLNTALRLSKEWKKSKNGTTWAGAYYGEEWRPSGIPKQKIQITHLLRIYSNDPRGSAKWFVDGPNIQKRIKCRVKLLDNEVKVLIDDYFPEHYGKKKKKGSHIVTLRKSSKGGITTLWEKNFLEVGSVPARFQKISPNPYQTWE